MPDQKVAEHGDGAAKGMRKEDWMNDQHTVPRTVGTESCVPDGGGLSWLEVLEVGTAVCCLEDERFKRLPLEVCASGYHFNCAGDYLRELGGLSSARHTPSENAGRNMP